MGLWAKVQTQRLFRFVVNEAVSPNYSGPNIRKAFWMALLFIKKGFSKIYPGLNKLWYFSSTGVNLAYQN